MGALCDSGTRSRGSLRTNPTTTGAPLWRGGWEFVSRVGTPYELVTSQPDVDGRRLVCVCRPIAPAIVIGSTQSREQIDDAARNRLGYGLVRRRSGGGAVVVAPHAQAWVDLFVPRDDPLFESDVSRAARFVADVWSAAITSKLSESQPIRPIYAVQPTPWSRVACFSGFGPGEVTVGERKVVGVSQRRDRSGAWFFTMALLKNAQSVLGYVLAFGEEQRTALVSDLSEHVGTLALAADDVEEALTKVLGANR